MSAELSLNLAIHVELAKAISDLSSNVITREIMGRRARAMLKANFTREHAFQNWTRVVDRVARSQA